MFIIEEFKAKKAQIAEQQKQLQNSLTDVFNKGIQELFCKYPNHLAQIYWTQFTPFFNDGDPCVFSVYEFYINGRENYDYDYEESDCVKDLYTEEELIVRENWEPDPSKRYDCKNFNTGLSPERIKDFEKAESELINFLNLFDENDFLYMFGDHVSVKITKNGILIDEYNHD